MIRDRHVPVVRQERIVGTELLSDIGRMVNRGIEVGVVSDIDGDFEGDVRYAMELAAARSNPREAGWVR